MRWLCCLISLLVWSCQSDYHRDEIPGDTEGISAVEASLLQEFLQQYPKDAEANYRMALLQQNQGDLEVAADFVRKATALDEEQPKYFLQAAMINERLGNQEQALQNALRAEALGSNHPDVFAIAAETYYTKGEWSQAMKYAQKAVAIQPENAMYNFQMGRLKLQTGDTSTAIAIFDLILREDSSYVGVYQQMAAIARSRGTLDTAIYFLQKGLSYQPRDMHFRQGLGELYLELDQPAPAIPHLKAAIGVDDQNQQALYHLSRAYAGILLWDSALLFIERAHAITATPEQEMLRAGIYDRQRKYTLAEEVYQDILKSDSTHQLARQALNKLRRKIAYLRLVAARKRELEQAQNMRPPILEKKTSDDNN